MKVLKWIAATLLVFLAVLLVGGFLLPSTFAIERSIEVAAPPAKVYALVADPRAWTQWSVWNKRDPQMRVVYSGAASGAGAKWAWQSQSEGDGAMTFIAAEPPRRVAYDLFFPDFGTTSHGDLRFEPTGAGTRVTWTMQGDMGRNPLFHWMALMSDRLIGKDFEAGLAGLKAAAEKS